MSDTKYYLSKENAKTLVECAKQNFSPISHTHTKNDVGDLTNDLDIIESLVLANKAAIEANASALKTMQTNIDALAAQVKLNEENLANFVAVSSQEIKTLF
jgi:hypothetical protein